MQEITSFITGSSRGYAAIADRKESELRGLPDLIGMGHPNSNFYKAMAKFKAFGCSCYTIQILPYRGSKQYKYIVYRGYLR